jgi:hypothetical protein
MLQWIIMRTAAIASVVMALKAVEEEGEEEEEEEEEGESACLIPTQTTAWKSHRTTSSSV